jgi:hypothetical protein
MTIQLDLCLIAVPKVGVEPTHLFRITDFESGRAIRNKRVIADFLAVSCPLSTPEIDCVHPDRYKNGTHSEGNHS